MADGKVIPAHLSEVDCGSAEAIGADEVFEVIETSREDNTARIRRKLDGQVYEIPLADLEAFFEAQPN